MLRSEFRPAAPRDLPQMAQLFTKRPAEGRAERMRARYRQEPTGWHVALVRDAVVGCCQVVFPRPGDAWLQWMRIAPSQQGEGIGGRFSDYIEEEAKRGGASHIRLNTMTSNVRVHSMMGGVRGYTEWARWSRWTNVSRERVRSWTKLRKVEQEEDPARILDWLAGQMGWQRSFRAATCPTDFRKTVSLNEELVRELCKGRGRCGILAAKGEDGIEAAAFYGAHRGELRVLQVVAETTAGGLAACAAALRQGRPKERLSVQLAGVSDELLARLSEINGRQHDFYVFGKRV